MYNILLLNMISANTFWFTLTILFNEVKCYQAVFNKAIHNMSCQSWPLSYLKLVWWINEELDKINKAWSEWTRFYTACPAIDAAGPVCVA